MLGCVTRNCWLIQISTFDQVSLVLLVTVRMPRSSSSGSTVGAEQAPAIMPAASTSANSRRRITDYHSVVTPDDSTRLRIVTYNIHRCRGMDRRTRPDRVAEVLRDIDADV